MLLSPDQLEVLSMDGSSARDDSNELATSCRWQSERGLNSVALTLNESTSFDLVYGAMNSSPGSETFQLKGFPAVREGPAGRTLCTIYVAIAASQVFAVEVSSRVPSSADRTCDLTARIAEAVIDTLRSRS